jgi:hypothetical protein
LVGASEGRPSPLVALVSARETVAAIATERERRLYGFCIYCARPCHGLACGAHRDLLTLDANQYEMRLRGANEKGQ